jgi:hypothetical protein
MQLCQKPRRPSADLAVPAGGRFPELALFAGGPSAELALFAGGPSAELALLEGKEAVIEFPFLKYA